MLRRKPSKIEVQIEDKEELEEESRRLRSSCSSSSTTTTATTLSTSLLHLLDRTNPTTYVPPPSKSHGIGLFLRKKTHKTNPKRKTKNKMEVEVKLRIPDLLNFNRLKALLSPSHLKTLDQKNYFFDTPTSALASHRAVLRLRLESSASSQLCFLTLKGKAKLANGVSRVEEDEEEIDPVKGEKCITDSAQLWFIESRVMKRCKEEFGMIGDVGFVCLGGFENVREVYGWRDGLKLEVDETRFGFGVWYEVECESEHPERAKGELEDLFRENGIQFKDSEKSKFAIFRSGKLPQ